jgi:hypothetical protein
MYDKINSCNDPESYCGGGCKYCIKTNNLKCVRKPSGGFLGGLLGGL